MTSPLSKDEARQIRADFRQAVNMPPAQLRQWLKSKESRSVGWTRAGVKHDDAGEESVGHKSGRRILRLKTKKAGDMTGDDLAHMKKVVGYVRRHLAQRPNGDVEHSRWRYSLMNWGHDPLKS